MPLLRKHFHPAADGKRRFPAPADILVGERDGQLPLKQKVEKYCLFSGLFTVRQSVAFSLPELKSLPGYKNLGGRSYRQENMFARQAIAKIITGAILPQNEAKEGWRYVLDSGAVRLEYSFPIKTYSDDRNYWASQARIECGGPGKITTKFLEGCHLARLSPFLLEIFPETMPEQATPGKLDNPVAMQKIGREMMETLRKPESECTREELSVLTKAKNGEQLERRFLFGSRSQEAQALFYETFNIPKSFDEANQFINSIAIERCIDYPHFFRSRKRFANLVENPKENDLRWCVAHGNGGSPTIERKPFYEFERPTTNEAILIGSDGRRYLAMREGGDISIYYDEKTVLDGLYKHPRVWTLHDIAKTGQKSTFSKFGSIYEFARAVVPHLMENMMEHEMRLTPKNLFRNTLKFDTAKFAKPCRLKRKKAEFNRIKKSLLPKSRSDFDSLRKVGDRCYLETITGRFFSAVKTENGHLIYNERRPEIAKAVYWIMKRYGKPIECITNDNYAESGLNGLIAQVRASSMLIMIAIPDPDKRLFENFHIRDKEEIRRRILALYPDWDEWVSWWGARKQGAAVGKTERKEPDHREKTNIMKKEAQAASNTGQPGQGFGSPLPPDEISEAEPVSEAESDFSFVDELEVNKKKRSNQQKKKKGRKKKEETEEDDDMGAAEEPGVSQTRGKRGRKKDKTEPIEWTPGTALPDPASANASELTMSLAKSCSRYFRNLAASFSDRAAFAFHLSLNHSSTNIMWENPVENWAGKAAPPKVSITILFDTQKGICIYPKKRIEFDLDKEGISALIKELIQDFPVPKGEQPSQK